MSDLTDEEIIATRKLHGLNDDLFKEGTGTNVGSINKIMERLKLLRIYFKTTKKVNEIITEKGSLNLAKDIETVLNLLKEKDKRIKELEIEVTNLYLNSIPKQKIKDKIKELANTRGDLATYIAVSERIKVLEELLEEKQ